MIALICASQFELSEFQHRLTIKREFSYQCCSFVEGTLGKQAILLAFSGRGSDHARQVAWLVLETYPVSLLISTGLCNAIDAGVRSGDIALYRHILDCIPVGEATRAVGIDLDPRLLGTALRIAGGKGYRVLAVTGATLPESAASVRSPAGANKTHVQVFDHESFPVCQLAAEKGFSFCCVRAVSTQTFRETPLGTDDLTSREAVRNLADFLTHFVSLI